MNTKRKSGYWVILGMWVFFGAYTAFHITAFKELPVVWWSLTGPIYLIITFMLIRNEIKLKRLEKELRNV